MLRALHAEKGRKPLLPLREARTRRTPIDWHADDLAAAPFEGARTVEEDIATLRGYVDWTFFFHAWELKGRFPAILDDPEKGSVARELYDDAIGKLAAGVGGSLESCYFAFGSDDIYAVVDAPSHEAMAAVAGTVSSTGALSNYETIVLLTAEQIDAAANINVDYTPPGG